jgi:hypothetical protein
MGEVIISGYIHMEEEDVGSFLKKATKGAGEGRRFG